MNYKSLKAIFYQDYDNFEENYKKRFDNIVAVKTNLFIYPFDKKKQKRLSENEVPHNRGEATILIIKMLQILKNG